MAAVKPTDASGRQASPTLDYLEIGSRQLWSKLRAGMSPGEIADATPGKSAAGLIDAIVVARKRRLAAALAAGRITKAYQDARLATLTERATASVRSRQKSPRWYPWWLPRRGRRWLLRISRRW